MNSFTVVFLAFCCHLAAVKAGDPITKDGLGCKTQGEFEYCEGKDPTYTTLAGQADSGDAPGLETRSFGPGGSPSYGFTPKERCDFQDQDKCEQFSVVTTPTFMKNANNQPRYILQGGKIQQKVQVAICSNNKCGRGGRCDQQYASVQLLACEPMGHKCRWQVDSFRVPSCCKCSNKFPGGHH